MKSKSTEGAALAQENGFAPLSADSKSAMLTITPFSYRKEEIFTPLFVSCEPFGNSLAPLIKEANPNKRKSLKPIHATPYITHGCHLVNS